MKRKRKIKTWKEIKMEEKEKNTPKGDVKEEKKEEVKVEVQDVEPSEKSETTIIHQTGQEAVIASMVKDFSKPLSKEDLDKVLIDLEPSDFIDPKKTILDEVKSLHPSFKIGEVKGETIYRYKYRFINNETKRLNEAFGSEHWKVVNRMNHPNLPARMITDTYGAIIFEDQMLCFREREIDERLNVLDFARHLEREKAWNEKDKNDPRFYRTDKYTSAYDSKPLVQDEESENRDFVENVVSEE